MGYQGHHSRPDLIKAFSCIFIAAGTTILIGITLCFVLIASKKQGELLIPPSNWLSTLAILLAPFVLLLCGIGLWHGSKIAWLGGVFFFLAFATECIVDAVTCALALRTSYDPVRKTPTSLIGALFMGSGYFSFFDQSMQRFVGIGIPRFYGLIVLLGTSLILGFIFYFRHDNQNTLWWFTQPLGF